MSLVAQLVTHAAIAAEGPTITAMDLVFSRGTDGTDQIYYATRTENGWTTPEKLSDTEEAAFHPVIARDKNGTKYVVWSQAEKKGVQLYYTLLQNGIWSKPVKIPTGIKDNRSASLVFTKENTPVIVWSGTVSGYPDIFCSRLRGGQWKAPYRINISNKVPDIEPMFHKDSLGHISVEWLSFVDGSYRYLVAELDTETYTVGKEVVLKENESMRMMEKIPVPVSLPSYIPADQRFDGSLFVMTENKEYIRHLQRQ